MKSFTINKNDAGQRADKFIKKVVPGLPLNLMYKYFRLKRFKLNKKPLKRDTVLSNGDILEAYINDEFFSSGARNKSEHLNSAAPPCIVYEDENILLCDKPYGQLVHSDTEDEAGTLIADVRAYLYQKGEYQPEKENSFAPALCNRIDRNTAGIVIIAKNAESLRILNEKIKNKEIRKLYLLRVWGHPKCNAGELRSYLEKNSETNTVYNHSSYRPGLKTAVTKYTVREYRADGTSIVEAELLTGRTHQLRVHFASLGHPLIGDGKYGLNEINKKFARYKQSLYSYKIIFAFTSPSGCLNYLQDREFTVKKVDFV